MMCTAGPHTHTHTHTHAAVQMHEPQGAQLLGALQRTQPMQGQGQGQGQAAVVWCGHWRGKDQVLFAEQQQAEQRQYSAVMLLSKTVRSKTVSPSLERP